MTHHFLSRNSHNVLSEQVQHRCVEWSGVQQVQQLVSKSKPLLCSMYPRKQAQEKPEGLYLKSAPPRFRRGMLHTALVSKANCNYAECCCSKACCRVHYCIWQSPIGNVGQGLPGWYLLQQMSLASCANPKARVLVACACYKWSPFWIASMARQPV